MELRKKILKEINDMIGMTKMDFFRKYQINVDEDGEPELNEIGSGDFGTAYSIGDGRVLKITNSKSEFEIAKELVGVNTSGFAKFFCAEIVNKEKWIIVEELDTDSRIEYLYYQVLSLCNEQGLPIQYIHMLDVDFDELDDDVNEFISGLEEINYSYRELGIEASDIRPENMGYDSEGNLKCFDIEDRSRHR